MLQCCQGVVPYICSLSRQHCSLPASLLVNSTSSKCPTHCAFPGFYSHSCSTCVHDPHCILPPTTQGALPSRDCYHNQTNCVSANICLLFTWHVPWGVALGLLGGSGRLLNWKSDPVCHACRYLCAMNALSGRNPDSSGYHCVPCEDFSNNVSFQSHGVLEKRGCCHVHVVACITRGIGLLSRHQYWLCLMCDLVTIYY